MRLEQDASLAFRIAGAIDPPGWSCHDRHARLSRCFGCVVRTKNLLKLFITGLLKTDGTLDQTAVSIFFLWNPLPKYSRSIDNQCLKSGWFCILSKSAQASSLTRSELNIICNCGCQIYPTQIYTMSVSARCLYTPFLIGFVG